MPRILIIEDELVMRQGLARLLQDAGYDTATVDLTDATSLTPLDLVNKIIASNANLILLDINLPGINGELLLKHLRQQSSTPVIMVTSRSAEVDEVLSMSYGADDYVTKPYNPQILLLRIAAVLKRMEPHRGPILFHHLSIDLNRGVIESQSPSVHKRILLTKNEMIILNHLIKHLGEIVTRDALMTDLWNNHEYINDNALTVNISRLRAKFKTLGLADAITTRKGLGYVLS